MADIIVGSIVLVVFIALTYNLFLKKKPNDCHSSPSCAGCSEGQKGCDHCTPEELKNELHNVLHPK
ncbi:MAG: FeoB-associated Cys-rich membrane protein [Erysipelotrichaceae bacterium]